jgi:hypothetical protein
MVTSLLLWGKLGFQALSRLKSWFYFFLFQNQISGAKTVTTLDSSSSGSKLGIVFSLGLYDSLVCTSCEDMFCGLWEVCLTACQAFPGTLPLVLSTDFIFSLSKPTRSKLSRPLDSSSSVSKLGIYFSLGLYESLVCTSCEDMFGGPRVPRNISPSF